MRIIIDAESLYEKLIQGENPNPQDSFFLEAAKQIKEGESWKNQSSDIVELPIQVKSNQIRLPFPFDHATLYLVKSRGNYLANFASRLKDFAVTDIRVKNSVEGIGKILNETYKERWSPMSETFGYIIDGEGDTQLGCGLADDKLHFNVLLGTEGTVKRQFSTYEEFEQDMKILGEVIRESVNGGIDTAVKQGYATKNPNLRLILG